MSAASSRPALSCVSVIGHGQRLAQFAESPAIDDGEVALHVPCRGHVGQQLARRESGRQRIFACMQFAGHAHLFGQQRASTTPARAVTPRCRKFGDDAAKAAAARDVDAGPLRAAIVQRRTTETVEIDPAPDQRAGKRPARSSAATRARARNHVHLTHAWEANHPACSIENPRSRQCPCNWRVTAPGSIVARRHGLYRHDATHAGAEKDLTGALRTSSGNGATRACGHTASTSARPTPATPQRSSAGVSNCPSTTANTLAMVAEMTWPCVIAQQAFGNLGIVPFGTRQHLLQPVQVFHPGQQRLLGQAQVAHAQAHALDACRGGHWRRDKRRPRRESTGAAVGSA